MQRQISVIEEASVRLAKSDADSKQRLLKTAPQEITICVVGAKGSGIKEKLFLGVLEVCMLQFFTQKLGQVTEVSH